LGLKVAAGAWIGGNLAQNDVEIANLIQAANAGQVDVAIVGSEALLRNDVSESQLVSYMRQVRQAIPQTIPVTTADTYGTLLAHQPVIDASDIVFGNFYPYWEGISIDTAMISLVQRYERLVAAAGNRRVVVSETGWPSAGNAVGAAIPSPANAAEYLSQFASWASSNNIPCFYFEAFDEDWKAAQEGPQGAHWGLWDASGVVKPGMQGVLGARASLDGVIGGPGAPALSFTYVPPYGSSDALEGQALHINPGSYGVAVYINAAGGWWSKPTFEQPVTQIEADGSWSARIVTGGVDQNASAISAFLIPAGFTPPALSGEPNLPPSLIANSVAQAQAQRSLASISGTVTDALGRSISGVTIGGGDLGTTTTAPDGKYSFYYVATVGSVSLTPSYPNFLFTPPSANINITGGSQIANFIGVARVDLSLTSSLSADPVTVGSSFTATVVVSNAGIGAASGAIVLMPLPSSFAVLSATTTRGSCTTAGTLVRCDVGPLAPTAYTTITVVIRPSVTGSFAVSASVSGPDSDSNAANDSTTQGITITPAASVMVQAWNAWVTAGKNDPSDRASAVWGSKFVVSYLDDGSVAAPTSCQVATFDKTGAALEYQVYDSVTSVRTPSFGTPAGLAPGWTSQFRLSSPLGDSAPFIGGPARITCYSTDPDALRTRVIVSRLFSLYDAGGKKLGEVSDQMNWTPSWRFSLPLMEGVEGGVNLANNGLAIFNAASADEAANPVTVRICLRDSSGNQGPCRDLTLNPATQNRVGETKVVVLSTLFGSDLYFPYPSGAQRGDSIYGTLTVESLGRTRIAVAGSLLTNGTTLTGVPSIPISTQ
jgi:hypothetical protein